ncbi:MAG: carbohydrate ABC transporter permease [Clostridiales bacterium]|jgi:putative aldouronate transport system permease protein|nr:carbohydrate ABC transporter permease [Clostridiales bacterium]
MAIPAITKGGLIIKTKRKPSEIAADVAIYAILATIGLLALYPLWNVAVLALNDPLDTLRGGIYLWPRMFTLNNLSLILRQEQLATAFKNSVLRTGIGVASALFFNTMAAYVISRKDFVFRKAAQRLLAVTMYVNGGLIPYYLVVKSVGLRNNFLVYILPMMFNAFYILIIRSFMDELPDSLTEAARIDGAGDFTVYWKVVLPLSAPVLATIGLFIAVDQWSQWFDSFVFTTDKSLTTLQYELVKVLNQSTSSVSDINSLRQRLQSGGQINIVYTPQSIRMAITIISTIPIVLVYPFIQKYFIKGVMIGAVKG